MKDSFPYRLYLVLSEGNCLNGNYLQVVEQAILGGVDIVQLREKKATTATFLERALRLQDVVSKYNVPLVINDNLDVAQRSGAHGIHVGNNDESPSYIRSIWKNCQAIGYSIEYLQQLQNVETEAADYLGISPVFKTATKKDTVTEWGPEGISQIRIMTPKPLVAIGNINALNAYNIIKAGADCIAVVSAICHAQNPMAAAREIKTQIERAL